MSVNLATLVGFSLNKGKVVEYLPKNEQFSSKAEQRRIFFSLYNHYVESDMKLSKKEIANGENIYEVFKNKIKTLTCCTRWSPSQIHVMRGYNTRNLLLKSLMLGQKFSQLIQEGSNKNLLFDLDDMFLHLVYERVKKVNPKSNIVLLEKSIVIIDPRENVSSTLLIPSYLKLERSTINSDPCIKEQMDEACKALNETEIKQVYLVYPKHPKFTKHINVDLHDKVRLSEEEYRVKMIPYSFSFCTRNRSKKQKIQK